MTESYGNKNGYRHAYHYVRSCQLHIAFLLNTEVCYDSKVCQDRTASYDNRPPRIYRNRSQNKQKYQYDECRQKQYSPDCL